MKDFFRIATHDSFHIIEFVEEKMTVHKSSQFLEILRKNILDVNDRSIILDLKNVQYTDSSFLGKLLFIKKKLKFVKKELVLISVNNELLNIINMAQVDKMLTVKDSIDSAVKYIKKVSS